MEFIWQELTSGLPDIQHLKHAVLRMFAAIILGALVGYERERAGKPAGFRTHILVCLGTAVVVLSCSSIGMNFDGLSRVIQGIVTGIGFIGAGSILKLDQAQDIKGLTTAAGLWLTGAIGIAVGLGALGVAILATVATLIVLALAGVHERRREAWLEANKQSKDSSNNKDEKDY